MDRFSWERDSPPCDPFFSQMTDREATDVGRVYELAETAERYLDHVFVGNC